MHTFSVVEAPHRHRPIATLMLSAIFATCAAGGALGQEEQVQTSITGGSALQEVVVAGQYEFLSANTSGTTNLPLAVEQVPQTVSLVSSDFLKAADLKTLGDIAEYTPGALNTGNQEGFGTLIKLRGFTPIRAFDGLNVGVLSPVSYEPDYAIVDRLEIAKGPSSVVYGVSSAGGLVNFVTKGATATTPSYLSVQGSSWDGFRVEGQLAGPLDPDHHLRAIGVVVRDQGDSFVTDVSHRTTVLYGGLDWSGAESLTAYLHGGYEYHVRTSFDGIPTESDGAPAPLPRSFFIGAENMELRTTVYHAESGVTWQPTDMFELSLKGNLRREDTEGPVPYSFGLAPGGAIDLAIQDFRSLVANDYGGGVSGIYHFDSLGLANSFVSVAALFQNDVFDLSEGQGLFGGTYAGPYGAAVPYVGQTNIFLGQEAIETAFNSAALGGPATFSAEDLQTLTLSAQTMLQVLPHLSLLGGASYSNPHITSTSGGTYQDYSPGSRMSYRGGLVYELLPGADAYVSFSQSFDPQIYREIDGRPLPPVSGAQYEAGLKYRPAEGVLFTAAGFQITQKNQGEFAAQVDGLDRYEPIGELRHRGIELEALGQPAPEWQLKAGYTYLEAKVTQDSDNSIVGQAELFLPRQTASAFSIYTFTDGATRGLSCGGGVRYIGAERTAYDSSTQDIPGYVVFDATAGYAIDGWKFQLNIHNLLNRRYYINNYDTLFYGNAPGAPLNVALSVRRDL